MDKQLFLQELRKRWDEVMLERELVRSARRPRTPPDVPPVQAHDPTEGRRRASGSKKRALYPAVPSLPLMPSKRQGDGLPEARHPGPALPELTGQRIVANELDSLARLPRAFDFVELSDLADDDVDRDFLRKTLAADQRFIWLEQAGSSGGLFVSRGTLFRWFVDLVERLAQIRKARLSEVELAAKASSLRREGRWETPPQALVRFGLERGFLQRAWTATDFVFPLANLASFASPLLRPGLLGRFFAEVRESQPADLQVAEILEAGLKNGAAWFEKRGGSGGRSGEKLLNVVLAREGLAGAEELTLEQIGASLGLTRERVRQLEEKFWKRISHPSAQANSVCPFVFALLSCAASRDGSVLFDRDSREGRAFRFMAKCAGIPDGRVPGTALRALGIPEEQFLPIQWLELPLHGDVDKICSYLDSKWRVSLVRHDMRAIAESLTMWHRKRLRKPQMLYFALKKIGRPAHYSEVSEAYRSMFPERPMSENAVHAALGREEEGVVWIGVRGTFALKEWGYEHPSKDIFDAVAEIVQSHHSQTRKPVHFSVIVAEIGKYRKIVKPSSLTFAAHLNPRLQRVGRESFVPREPSTDYEVEMTPADLDRILGEFEKSRRNGAAV